jgi:hypothetical protein
MFTENSPSSSSMVCVIGGGIGGCITALKLAENNLAVTIIEKNLNLLSGTSDNTPGRLGLGFHYLADIETAKKYLSSTINFIKEYSGFMLGETLPDSDYLKKGRYFVTKDSMIPADKVIKHAKLLQNFYADLVKKDIKNQLFGKPEEFFRILNEEQYVNDINSSKVVFAIETQEHLVDWPKFKKFLLGKIYSNKNITVLNGFNVSHAEYNNFNDLYKIYTQSNFVNITIESSYVINCCWENIENINKIMGFNTEQEIVSNRLKILAEVALPNALKYKNSMFFCVGPHCMFSNLGNGIGRITFAPLTNVASNISNLLDTRHKNWIEKFANSAERQIDGENIIKGISNYIPAMKDAKLLRVLCGVVKNKGLVDIYDANSDFHKRSYSGVTERAIGWIDNACIKLFYCEDNSQEVLNIISKHVRLRKENQVYLYFNRSQDKVELLSR